MKTIALSFCGALIGFAAYEIIGGVRDALRKDRLHKAEWKRFVNSLETASAIMREVTG